MARLFDVFTSPFSHRISLAQGATRLNYPLTCALIARRDDASNDAYHCLFSLYSGAGTSQFSFYICNNTDGDGPVIFDTFVHPGEFATSMVMQSADGWCVIAVTKATTTADARFHKIRLSDLTAEHEDSSGGTLANNATSTAADIGRNSNFADTWNGAIDLAGLWNRVLSDQEIETLAQSIGRWVRSGPVGLWRLDQSAVRNVIDLTGGGANETARTGTVVAADSVPIGYGHREAWDYAEAPAAGRRRYVAII